MPIARQKPTIEDIADSPTLAAFARIATIVVTAVIAPLCLFIGNRLIDQLDKTTTMQQRLAKDQVKTATLLDTVTDRVERLENKVFQ